MPKRLELNKENFTLEELRVASNCAPKKEGFKRYQAIEFLYTGDSKQEVCRRCHISIRTLNRWIRSLNEEGLDGLAIKGKSGRPRKIDVDKFRCEYIPLVLSPEEIGSWTAIKFHTYLKKECNEELCYKTLLNYFHENNLSLVRGRPYNIKQDDEKREKFILDLKEVYSDKTKEIWFSDEVGFEGDPRPRSLWVTKGTKHKVKRSHEHLRFNAVGAVNPETGEFFSLAVPHNDHKVFQVFLDEFSQITKGMSVVVVFDNASWHKVSNLNWHNIEPMFLPPYSPDLNPIENVWRLIKINFFNSWFAKNIEQLIDRVCVALNWLSENPKQVAKTASMQYLLR